MHALKIADKISSLILSNDTTEVNDFLAGKAVTSILHDAEFLDAFRRKSFRLFIDMDGVLTDWMKQYKDFGGQSFTESKDIDWDVTNSFPYWSTMKWMPKGEEFWDSVKHLNPVILSSPGRSTFAKEGKSHWIKENLGEAQPNILDTQKHRYADGRSILVDDMPKNIDPWNEREGKGVLYKDPSSAAREIYRAVLG